MIFFFISKSAYVKKKSNLYLIKIQISLYFFKNLRFASKEDADQFLI